MKKIKLIAVIIFLAITVSCSIFKFLKGDWWPEPINLNKMRENFEAIPNVRVIKVFYTDIDLDWFGAIIIIDGDKLLILRHLKENDFSGDEATDIFIDRIGNYSVSCYSYNRNVTRTGLFLGKDTTFYNTLFALGEINNIESIINNYDLILYGVEQLPDDDCSLSNPHNNYGFWNPHDLESKNNLLHFTYINGEDCRIGKIKHDEINDYSILDENIDKWDLVRIKD
jgi:hypothetical protein